MRKQFLKTAFLASKILHEASLAGKEGFSTLVTAMDIAKQICFAKTNRSISEND